MVPEPYLVTVPFLTFSQVTVPVPNGKKSRFLRFWFHNTGDSKSKVIARAG